MFINAGGGPVRPEIFCQCCRRIVRGTNVRNTGFRALQRAFTAHYVRGKVSVLVISHALKRSGVSAALGGCSRLLPGRRGTYVRGLRTVCCWFRGGTQTFKLLRVGGGQPRVEV